MKYSRLKYLEIDNRQWPSSTIDCSPRWCSVDLRDGNQALPRPMLLEERMKLFRLLVRIGFRELEVAFPSASTTDFDFVRQLVKDPTLASDAYLQVIMPGRPELIEK